MKKQTPVEQWFARKLERRRKFRVFMKEAGKFTLLAIGIATVIASILGIVGGFIYTVTEKEKKDSITAIHQRLDAIQWSLYGKEDKKRDIIYFTNISSSITLTNTTIYWTNIQDGFFGGSHLK